MTDREPVRLLGPGTVADWFGAQTNTVIVWWRRHPDMPQPHSIILTGKGEIPGWLPEQETDIREWFANRRFKPEPEQFVGKRGSRRPPVTKDEAADALRSQVVAALEQAGFQRSERNYHPTGKA